MFEYGRRRCACPLWAGFAIVMLFMATAQAENFTVDRNSSNIDTVDAAPGNGSCADAAGICTLRAAIQEANALAGADTITLPAGVFQLSLSGANEEAAATGDLDITDDLTITGAGATLTTIDGGSLDRVFDIGLNSTQPRVFINDLTIRNGAASGSLASGGAIRVNLGTVELYDCSLSGNHTDANGGAISNGGNLTLNRSTLSTNTAGGNGAGLFNASSVTLNNSTLSGNTATSSGGGLYNAATATLVHTTFALNGAASGGGLYNAGSATLKSTLLSANTVSNCAGTVAITSQGTNLDSGTSCAFSAPETNVNPLLDALSYNGGQTATHALLSGSPAIDTANNTGCPLTDQRGVGRPKDGDGDGDGVGACDIGAFEVTFPADLSISKNHQADCVELHDPLIYTISVTNNGPGSATDVTVTDILPVGVNVVSTSTSCSQNGGTLICVLGTLSAGAATTLTINTTADKVALLTNTASVLAAESDPDSSNNNAEVQTRVNCAKGCFIATAAYGSSLAPQVQHLRTFRDRFLTPYPIGQWFVNLYYRYSPTLADVLAQHDDLRAVVRTGLRPLIRFAQFVNEIPPNPDGAAP